MKLKDKKIDILAPRFVSDGIGNRVKVLEHVARVWAYVRQLSGKEIYGTTTKTEEEILFRINFRKISTSNVIRYQGILYNIVRVDTFEGYREDLALYCKRE